MMRLTKRVFSAFLAFVMVFTMLPLDVWAQDGQSSNSVVAPMNVVEPDENNVDTYQFYVDGELKDTQYVMSGDTVFAPESPEQKDSKFTGWYNESTQEKFVEKTVETATGTTYRYNAKFEQVYYVFFLNQDGVVCTTKEGISGDAISTADVTFPLPTDQGIVGWYRDPEWTDLVQGDVVINGANITLYPKVAQGSWITFESDGGSYIAPVFVAPGKETEAPTEPTRLGYTFQGWYEEGSDTPYQFGSTLGESVTLIAKWKPTNSTYTVFYWAENADDDNDTLVCTGTGTGLTGTAPTVDTNNFPQSWDSEKYPTRHFSYETQDDVTIAGDGSTILNVYYSRKTYTLTFQKNEGSYWRPSWQTVATITDKYDAEISGEFSKAPFSTTYAGRAWEDTEGTYDYALQTLDRMPGNNVTFHLYNKSSDRLKTIYYYVEKADAVNTPDRWPSSPGSNYELLKTVTTYFNWATYEEEYHEIAGFTRFSASDAGFDGSNQKRFSNGTLSLYYKRNSYDITYMNGDRVWKTQDYKYQASLANAYNQVPVRPAGVPDEYEFLGWYTAPDGGQLASKVIITMPLGGTVVYAQWGAPNVTATVHLTMAGTGTPETIPVPYGTKISEDSLPEIEVPEGYTWHGWATKDGDIYTPFNFETVIYNDIILYPYYTSNAKFTVVYEANGGSGTVTDAKEYKDYAYANVQSADALTAPAGKVFLGWNTELDGNGDTYLPGDKLLITEALADDNHIITLYAIWGNKAPTATLVYHANGGTGTNGNTVTENVANNKTVTLKTAGELSFTRDGYEFQGWSKESAATEAEFAAGDSYIVNRTGTSDGVNTLYAVWKQVWHPGTQIKVRVLLDDQVVKASDYIDLDNLDGGTHNFASIVSGDYYVVKYDYEKLDCADIALTVTKIPTGYHVESVESDNLGPTEAEGANPAELVITPNDDRTFWSLDNVPGGALVTVKLEPNTDTAYKVEHYLENLEGTGYDLKETENKTGATGATVNAVPKTYAGFTYDSTVEGTVTSGTISGDGNLVLKLYYTRDTDTAYKVEHYLENLEGTGYDLEDTQNKTGTTGATVNAVPKTYAGFTYDSTVEGTVTSGTITGDGNLTLKLYYKRNSYTVSYEYTSDVPGASTLPTEATVKYGAEVTVAADATAPGYTFSGWSDKAGELSTAGGKFNMPAKDVVLVGSWTIRTDLSYTINYYWVGDQNNPIEESVTVENQTFNDKVTLSGDQLKTIPGYTLIPDDYGIIIGVDENVINVLYYKNVTLKADSLLNVPYDGDTHEVTSYTVTDEGKNIITGLSFEGVTAYGSGELVGNYPVEFFVNGTKVDVTELVGEKDSNERYYVTVAEEGTITITDDNVPDGKVVTKKDGKDDSYEYALGETVSYTITVKNIYNKTVDLVVSELPGVTIVSTVPETLGAGEEITIQATYVIQEQDVLKGSFTNHVTVTLDDKPFEGEDPVVTEESDPKLTVAKTITSTDENNDGIYGLDETITYKITVKNDGNVTVTGINVADQVTVEGENRQTATVNAEPFDLEPGEKKSFEYQYTVHESDLGKTILNTATAIGGGPNQEEVPGTDDVEAETEERNPELDVTKTATKPANGTEYALDETITYTIKVKNTGNVTLENIFVSDKFSRDGGTTWEEIKDKLTPSASTPITLEPGEQKTYTYQYTVVEEDLGKTLQNTATAIAPNPDDPSQTVTDKATTPGEKVEDPNPDLSVDKKVTSDPGSDGVYDLGDTITYTLTVQNEGNVTLTGVKVTDELKAGGVKIEDLPVTGGDNITLKPNGHEGDTVILYVDYTVTEEDLGKTLVNTATATAEQTEPEDPNKPVEDKDETDGEKTEDPTPNMEVSKTVVGDKGPYRVGDVITYKITVNNTGNTTLHNLSLVDSMNAAGKVTFTDLGGGTQNGSTVTLASLAPKAVWTVTCTYKVQLADADSEGTVISNKVVVTSDGGPNDDSETPGEKIDPIYTVVIKYQNGAGRDLHDPAVVKVHDGQKYSVDSPNVPGYHLTKANEKTVSGTLDATNPYISEEGVLTLVVVYARNPVEEDDDDPVVNPDNDPDETTEETEDEVDPGVYIEDPDDYTLTPITEEEPPLADLDVGDHTCCIMHFLLMLAAMVVLGFYTDSKKKHQARIFELKRTLAMEKGKNPDGDNSQQS